MSAGCICHQSCQQNPNFLTADYIISLLNPTHYMKTGRYQPQFIKLDGSALIYSGTTSLQDQLPLAIRNDAVNGVRDFRSEQL